MPSANQVNPDLVPVLAVTDIAASVHFWVNLLGFQIKYQRPAEGFAYLICGNAHVMLDQIGLTRTWATAPLESPLGRGINFQIDVPDIEPILVRLAEAHWNLFMAPEEKWYGIDHQEVGVKQFLVQDPDGYLIRLSQTLGTRTPT